MTYYPYPLIIPMDSSSNEEECYAEVLGLSGGEMNKAQYAECLERKEVEDIQGAKVGLGIAGGAVLLTIFLVWLLTK